MSGDAITTGVFGTLILAAIIYLGARIDRLEDRIDNLADKIVGLTDRVSHIEGRLDEREHH
jgi:uncharacterized protein (DUF111 family)